MPASAPSAPSRAAAPGETDRTRAALRRYYTLHARIYDRTRWTFLFGRARLVDRVVSRFQPRRILEIGCGTGTNLQRLAHACPDAALTGWDGSREMLERARRRLLPFGDRCRLREGFVGPECDLGPAPDLVLASYCLSMVNPGAEDLILAAARILAPGGVLAVVDFHGTPWTGFRRWMAMNHVRLERHLLPVLRKACHPILEEVRPAWGGAWEYVVFLGHPLPRPEPGAVNDGAPP